MRDSKNTSEITTHTLQTRTIIEKRSIDTTEDKSSEIEPTALPLEFEHKSGNTPFKFKQMAKSEKGFIYEVDDEGVIHYEVFEKRINRRFNTISYPNDNSFGVWAWTYRDKEKAYKRLNGLS